MKMKILSSIVGISAGIAMSVLITVSHSDKAEAAGSIDCGSIQCSVTTSHYVSGSDETTPSNGGGGGTDTDSGTDTREYDHTFTACSYWFSGNTSGSYNSAKRYGDTEDVSGTWACHFDIGRGDTDQAVCPSQNGHAAYGLYKEYVVTHDKKGNVIKTFNAWWCSYPLEQYTAKTTTKFERPLGSTGYLYHVNNAGQASSTETNGTLVDQSGYMSSKPAFNSKNPYADVKLNDSWNAKTGLVDGQPWYGWYSLHYKVKQTQWSKTTWGSWMNKAPVYKHVKDFNSVTASPYTYGCNLSPALKSGIVAGAKFSASDCESAHWSCSVTGTPKIAKVATDVKLLRNGKTVSVTMPTFGIKTGGVVKDITLKQVFYTLDSKNVTPYNPQSVNANSSNQYFKANFQWNTWTTYDASGNDIKFFWSSDNHSQFKFSTSHKFYASFLTNTQASKNGATVKKWVKDSALCGDMKVSNNAVIVRSVNG